MAGIDTQQLQDAVQGARYLLGKLLVHEINGQRLSGTIIETEAYHQTDTAAHTFRGLTERNRAMFGPAGHAYIYRSYGLHWCLNVTAGAIGEGAGILLRAIEPVEGLEVMRSLRKGLPDSQLTNGPGKLAAALGVTHALYGHDLARPPLFIEDQLAIPDDHVVIGPRIGISQNADALLRFYVRGNPFVSRK